MEEKKKKKEERKLVLSKHVSQQRLVKHQNFYHGKWMIPALECDPTSCIYV